MAPEGQTYMLSYRDRTDASMRPGRGGPGRRSRWPGQPMGDTCFNEAGARWPRKASGRWSTSLLCTRASMRPGRGGPGRARLEGGGGARRESPVCEGSCRVGVRHRFGALVSGYSQCRIAREIRRLRPNRAASGGCAPPRRSNRRGGALAPLAAIRIISRRPPVGQHGNLSRCFRLRSRSCRRGRCR